MFLTGGQALTVISCRSLINITLIPLRLSFNKGMNDYEYNYTTKIKTAIKSILKLFVKGLVKMREILFRAKRKDNGEWIEGFTLFKPDQHLYMFKTALGEITYDLHYNITAITGRKEPFFVEVIPETVGQYTGLTDRNGVKIFEGDVVRECDKNCAIEEFRYDIGKVFYHEKDARFLLTSQRFPDCWANMSVYREYEVIGNIYDNPELLKGELK